jgi:hypothetical protein
VVTRGGRQMFFEGKITLPISIALMTPEAPARLLVTGCGGHG